MHRDQLPIDTPCAAAWDAMPGDVVRHCARCDRPVHDLSAMRHADALRLLDASPTAPCVRYTAAADGTLRFRDLVPRASLTRKLRTAVAASLLAACAPRSDTRPPEPTPPGPVDTPAASPAPQLSAAASDACEPLPDRPPAPSGALEDQQRAAAVDAALLHARDRIGVLDERVVLGKITVDLERKAADMARRQAEVDAAERERLLELERQAESAD